MNLQTGAFGDPTSIDTLIMFWSKMEMLHYPGAGDVKKKLEEQLKAQQMQAYQQQMMQLQQQQIQQQRQREQNTIAQAQADAQRDIANGQARVF